ncbi:MAG TPA: ATP-binding protein [Verrucomicrobiae bacterium]|nr:ATP-binding protein [Verrucomicrobiae bacterium]
MLLLLMMAAFSARAQTITNLQQLTQVLNLLQRTNRDVRLEVTVCAASRPGTGALIVQDGSGVELLEMGSFEREIQPGERVRIQGESCLLRKRDMGVQISAPPVVDNDGIQTGRTCVASITLKAGQNPIQLEWFNHLREFALEVLCSVSNAPVQSIGSSNLWHAVVDESGGTNFLPGLRAEDYEGYWEMMPDFNLLQPTKVGIVTNFDLGFRTHDEMVGIRYAGFFKAPEDGQYQFRTRSDDGSLLYFGKPELPVIRAGFTNVPVATPGSYGDAMGSLSERRWVTIGGRVGFISKSGRGLEFELRSDHDVILVKVADAADLDPLRLRNAQVRVTGIGRGVLAVGQHVVFDKLMVASSREIELVKNSFSSQPPLAVVSINQVQSLPLEEARRALPVRVRGVATDARNSAFDRRMSIQDDTRGIFVNLDSITNQSVAFAEFLEVEGHSGAGDFAPVIIADKVTILGEGRLPEPARPTWTELLNGSKDVQWAELQGLVTDVQSNKVSLLLPEGRLEVLLDGCQESQLKSFEKNVARIRGVLYAMWNAETREVRVGSVMMRNATISVDAPAPSDPFDAVVKTPRELRLFDAQATAFRRVKVRGQIGYADETQIFLEDGGVGLRLLPSEKTDFHPGDWVEAVGYPDIGRTTLLLREVILRKTGEAALPAAKTTKESELALDNLDSTRISVEGKLLGWHLEHGQPVLEMQSGQHLFLARLPAGDAARLSLRAGSRLELDGIYLRQERNPRQEAGTDTFELVMNSPADIKVLSQPSWWTLQRLLIIVAVLIMVLIFASVWITQLRRLVEKRTAQLERETREREQVEKRHALETERSRIARDLHDDLGSSLTEISVLASTGQRPPTTEASHTNLFKVIAGKARGLISALDVIVWAVDPEDNSLQSLADYLSGYADEFFSHTSVACRFKVPVAFPPITLEGRVRHDLLLAVKESLNNIVRHAEASEVEFRMAVSNEILEIEVADNGKGFESVPESDRHGLKNLSARLEKIGGNCTVESRLGGGTTVKISLPLVASGGARPDAKN